MFERFTERARRVVVLAQEEARLLNHNYIGTEHLLLALIHEREGVAARALAQNGLLLDETRKQVVDLIGIGKEKPQGHLPFTPRAKKSLELSLRDALQLGHNYISTEHLLLGLLRENEGVASQIIRQIGNPVDLRHVTLELMQTADPDPDQTQGASALDDAQRVQAFVQRASASRDDRILEALEGIEQRLAAIEEHLRSAG